MSELPASACCYLPFWASPEHLLYNMLQKKRGGKKPKTKPNIKNRFTERIEPFYMEILFSHIYIYLYIICENDTSKSYFHIYTFSFLEEFHPSFTSFHTQQASVQGGQWAHGSGNSQVQQQNALHGWKSCWSLALASQRFVFIGLQILLGVSLLTWLFVCEPCRLPFQN